jgi:3-mercaptopyruvate sulfurtransferase SseA
MAVQKAFLLIKDQCPHCEHLKQFLALALRNHYQDCLEYVHQTNNAEQFATLVSQHGIKETPALIMEEDVLQGFAPQATLNFLIKHFGKRP